MLIIILDPEFMSNGRNELKIMQKNVINTHTVIGNVTKQISKAL